LFAYFISPSFGLPN